MIGIQGWRFWLFIVALTALHFLLHLTFGLAGPLIPDLLTLAVLLGARQVSSAGASLLGFALGLLSDALSITAFGANALALTVVAFLGARSRNLFIGESVLFVAVYLFIGKWLHDSLHYLLARDLYRADAAAALLVDFPLAALYLSAIGVVLMLLFRSATRLR